MGAVRKEHAYMEEETIEGVASHALLHVSRQWWI